jgi:hypothetical protein
MATDAVVATAYPNVRRWPRYKLRVPVRVVLHKPSKTQIVDGRGTELNEGGMAVFAGTEINVGDRVEVEFTPPYTGQPIRVRCEVRQRNGYTYGVSFLLLDHHDERQVAQIREVLRAMGSPAA